ncbi:MAG: M28 family peptidase [Candidatus Hydrogenedentes bacterium]|nr:M28 family peptidase [Candidatus Hydrogenedentota bacterium]
MLKLLALMGFAAFVVLFFAAQVLKRSLRPDVSQRVKTHTALSPFDSRRAFADLNVIVALGPRPPGSSASERLRSMIRKELAGAGLGVKEQVFEARTPVGPRRMVNLYGIVEGTRPGVIVVGNHYDTKYLPDIEFVGANDGGSATAWMIEMARALGPRREGRSVWLCFFDGEEAFGQWSESDSLYGSRSFVADLRSRGALSEVHAMINVDMIGDCYLGIGQDQGAPEWLMKLVWDQARAMGYSAHFLKMRQRIEDDHIPFRRAGIPALNLIDFSYGGSILDHQRNWHTARDTIERVCPESLQAVGEVLYHALPRIDAYLEASGRSSGGTPSG